MGSMTAAGTGLAMSAGTPATMDLAGFAALTYTEVGQVEQIGSFGATQEVVSFQPLKGALQKYKGPSNSGALSPSLAIDEADAGQTLLRTAAADKTQKLYSTKVTLQDGTPRYFQGRVFGYPETVGAANSMLMANPSIEISSEIFKGPATP